MSGSAATVVPAYLSRTMRCNNYTTMDAMLGPCPMQPRHTPRLQRLVAAMRRRRVPRERPQPSAKRIWSHRTRAPLHQLEQIFVRQKHARVAQEHCRRRCLHGGKAVLFLCTTRTRHCRKVVCKRGSSLGRGEHEVKGGRSRRGLHLVAFECVGLLLNGRRRGL